jgi:tetratricopeptide (TPR) repeat protein
MRNAWGRAALLFAAASFLGAAPARAGVPEWKQLYDQSELHYQRNSLDQSELFAREALREAEAVGPAHRTVELSLARLVFVLRLAGKPDEALPFAERAVKLAVRNHGAEGVETAIAMQSHADILFAQKKFQEAEKLHRRALGIFEKRNGLKHFQTATSLHNVGTALLAQQKYKDAETFLRRALAVKDEVLQRGHRSITHTVNNLALALEGQGRQAEADKLRARVTEAKKP